MIPERGPQTMVLSSQIAGNLCSAICLGGYSGLGGLPGGAFGPCEPKRCQNVHLFDVCWAPGGSLLGQFWRKQNEIEFC